MKIFCLIMAGFLLSACQITPLSAPSRAPHEFINVFEIPQEMSRIVLPDGIKADRVTVTVDGGFVKERLFIGSSVIRYSTYPKGSIQTYSFGDMSATISNFNKMFSFNTAIKPEPIDLKNIGSGYVSISKNSHEFCAVVITNHGPREMIEDVSHHQSALVIILCDNRSILESASQYRQRMLRYMKHISVL